ncbi:MAG: bifunctional acetate--CoA ligase family protein/GNAT family N-acetyltransferase [Nitrosomonas sp.]|uniref:bifunctional acetate--CoA ligase family protein/GNAT family N-acetyltransferase n=1 Tax=Nitrosomonas sp. TaxID=42353 RepID=UPI0027334B9C|nr:bifunctional acetate--CoA ligase family protein/GNAT family N-acetyltransferase [Nitrosomonas sp.]MDP3662919.1 bifunctional acetate--CoA ligase family protein/GNAT family N-acetyltransferase [Nitrosomonas sp.]MDZ4105222.1 bifunctional acetate--CoA ligase family protein/GNAT family N-acetyltransferase [Nitrosomonas sp.]
MGQHYLKSLFSPESVAIFGASDRIDSVGQIVLSNMLKSGYKGALFPINPKHEEIQGHKAYASLFQVSEIVELAVIATPAQTVPDIIEDCGKHGIKAAVIISAGFSETGATGQTLERAVLENARRYGIRLLGPNCLGIMRPDRGLNATFNKGSANAGNLAFVSQSGALCTAILDWAQTNDVGFSSVVSLGSTADVDFGEILDYLVTDQLTQNILLYIEGIRNARSFMSSLRAAARIKPVILVKVGRHAAGSKAAMSHTASLVGSDDAFDAAVRRAGVVRVQTITQLFSAAKALSCGFHPSGNRLAIVTNGGGPGVMATDHAIDLGLEMATLSDATMEQLNQVLPPTWSHGNPVDVIGDAQADRYQKAVRACLEDSNVDGVLAILTPQAMTKPLEAANTLIELSKQYSKPLLTCWMGESQVAESRVAFNLAKKPNFRTPEPAVEVFSYLSAYYRNQKLLMQMPGPLSHHLEPDVEAARMIIDGALQDRRKILSEMESKALLSAFHIPVAQTMIAHSPNEAMLIAQQLGFPVVMKVNSRDITHKTDAGGVLLNLVNAQAVTAAYHTIIANVKLNRPDAQMDGVSIEPMVVKPNGRELMVGVTYDAVFGPVITFGAGGTMVEVIGDRAVVLPPLNTFLVRDLIQSTHAAKMLGTFRHMPPVAMAALESVLLRVSEMVCELPALTEMDINPLIVDEHGALAADARIVIALRQPSADRYAHMAIYPYPTHLISTWQLADGRNITIRPIRPEDAEIEQAFVRGLSEEARYFRFMFSVQELSQAMLLRFTQIDYSREMALIAVTFEQDKEIELGVARFAISPEGESCEFALVIADAMQGKGLGQKLMTALMDAARAKGLKVMAGEVLKTNTNMLKLMNRLGFSIEDRLDDDNIKRVRKIL